MFSTRVPLPSTALVLSAPDQTPVHRGLPVLESRADVSPRLINSADLLDSFNAVHSGRANDAVIDIPHQLDEESMDLVESIGDEPVNRNAILVELKDKLARFAFYFRGIFHRRLRHGYFTVSRRHEVDFETIGPHSSR